jgi:hypothetical protein
MGWLLRCTATELRPGGAAAIRPIESELDDAALWAFGGGWGSGQVNYKGIEYTIKMTKPGIWKYRFQIGRAIKVGTTRVKLEQVAVQRVQKRIDRELKIAGFHESA